MEGMMRFPYVFFSFFLLSCYFRFLNAQSIIGLDASLFAATLRDHELVFVAYYAPWCGHCTAMDSELKEVATTLHRDGYQARIALVDATAEKNKELTKRESIDGFPTLILYKDGKRLTEYHGQRKNKEIVEFIKRKSGQSYHPVSTLEEIQDFNAQVNPDGIFGNGIIAVALGLFPPASAESGRGLHSKAAKEFYSISTKMDNILFLLADNINLVRYFGITEDSLIIFAGGDDPAPTAILPLTSAVSEDEMGYLILNNALPLVLNFNEQTQPLIKALPVQVHTLLFYPPIPGLEDAETNKEHHQAQQQQQQQQQHKQQHAQPQTQSSSSNSGDKKQVPGVAAQSQSPATTTTTSTTTATATAATGSSSLNAFEFDELMQRVAPAYRGRTIFLRVQPTETSLLQFFGIQSQFLPQIVIADMRDPYHLKRFNYAAYNNQQQNHNNAGAGTHDTATTDSTNGQSSKHHSHHHSHPQGHWQSHGNGIMKYTEENLHYFFGSFFDGSLPRTIASEQQEHPPPPPHEEEGGGGVGGRNQGAAGVGDGDQKDAEDESRKSKMIPPQTYVVKVVAENFNEKVVNNEDQDVFIVFSAPWCGHSKALEPVLHQVANIYRHDPTIKIAKIDGSKNEVDFPSVKIKGFPTLYFFRAGDKQNPMEYDGDRTKDAIAQFIDTFRRSSLRRQTKKRNREEELPQSQSGRKLPKSGKSDEL